MLPDSQRNQPKRERSEETAVGSVFRFLYLDLVRSPASFFFFCNGRQYSNLKNLTVNIRQYYRNTIKFQAFLQKYKKERRYMLAEG